MPRDDWSDLRTFVAVAEERSFTRAAARLGVSPSAASHALRALEERLGLRLLTRTTRNVATTEAGERLLRAIAPRFDEIEAEIDALSELRDKPAGTLRITSAVHAADTILRPRLAAFLPQYPDVSVEVSIDNGFVDVVGGHFDAGIRLGESVSKDMIAVRIGPDFRFLVVGAPGYLDRRGVPAHPRDLTEHLCVNLRMESSGALYAWEFEKDGRAIEARVTGQITHDSIVHVVQAAVDGLGLAYVPEDLAADHIAAGRLRVVLGDWCPPVQGYHLYYPNRRLASPAFARFVEALRYRA